MDDNLIIEDNVLKGCRQSKAITITIPEGNRSEPIYRH